MSQWHWDQLRLGFLCSYHSWDIQEYSQYVPMVLVPIKTGILALLPYLGHSRIFSVCPNGIGTNEDWDSGPLTIAGTFKDILSMSQWYWDRLRLGFCPSYHSWDIQGYSQYVPMVLGPIKTGILALLP